MTVSKADRERKLLNEALAEFDAIQAAQRDERLQCLEDRRFYSIAGAQWEGALGEQFENLPRFELNRVHQAVIRVINEYRNNRITVDFVPEDGEGDEKLADTCDGMYRADEKASAAEEAYDNTFEEGVGGGMGAYRMRAAYVDEDDDEDERQRVLLEPIHDADSCVFFDLGAKRQDKADAKRCYVLTPYTREAYKEEFGDDPTTWPKDIQRTEFDWCTPDLVWVAEHYRIEEVKDTVRIFAGLMDGSEEVRYTDSELKADPELLEELQALGYREVRQKNVRRKQVRKWLLSGGKVLEDCGVIPGRFIPIIVFFAKRWVVDGVERCMGHVRLAKDAQRLNNALMSWLANMAARFDVEKPIFSPEQIAGHAVMWAEDNVKRYPYLLANPQRDSNGDLVPGSQAPVAYTKAPNIPPAVAALAQIAEQALKDLLGGQEAGEKIQPNLSGKAVELIQQRLDMQTFIYMSNFARAVRHGGRVWLSMMRDIVVEENRRMKTIGREGEIGSVVVNRRVIDRETGEERLENDLSKATFDVVADVGPTSSSARAATVRALTGMMQMVQDPETNQVLSSLALMNIEGEGLQEAREFFRRKLLRMGVVKPTEQEAQELAQEQAGAQPDPQAQALMGMAEESVAKAAKARADTVETIASAELKRAQTAETMARVMGDVQAQQLASTQALQGVLDLQGSPQVNEAATVR